MYKEQVKVLLNEVLLLSHFDLFIWIVSIQD